MIGYKRPGILRMIGIFNLFIGWLDYSKWIHKVSFFLSLGLSLHGLWCKNSCEILFKPYISIQNLKEHYMSHPRIMPFSNSNSEFRSWWPERLQPCSENPKTGNWEALTEKPGPINQPTFCCISNTKFKSFTRVWYQTLPETVSLSLKMDASKTRSFPFQMAYFQG